MKKKQAKKPPVQRNKYTPEQKDKARKYYLMGLSLQEISLLLNGCPVRTLEKWQNADKWTEYTNALPLKQRVLELREAKKSYNEIATLLNISPVTVWRYLKEARQIAES